MEAVPEFTPERAPVTTFIPRRAVGLMSNLERASDSEPIHERSPAPVDSPERAPVPEFGPRRAPVPVSGPENVPVPEFSPVSSPNYFFFLGGGYIFPAWWPDRVARPRSRRPSSHGVLCILDPACSVHLRLVYSLHPLCSYVSQPCLVLFLLVRIKDCLFKLFPRLCIPRSSLLCAS